MLEVEIIILGVYIGNIR